MRSNYAGGWLYIIFVCHALFSRHVIGPPRDIFWPMVKFTFLENHQINFVFYVGHQS